MTPTEERVKKQRCLATKHFAMVDRMRAFFVPEFAEHLTTALGHRFDPKCRGARYTWLLEASIKEIWENYDVPYDMKLDPFVTLALAPETKYWLLWVAAQRLLEFFTETDIHKLITMQRKVIGDAIRLLEISIEDIENEFNVKRK